jgi:hypothetical protein
VTRARVRKRKDLIFRENDDGVLSGSDRRIEKLSRTGLSTMTKSNKVLTKNLYTSFYLESKKNHFLYTQFEDFFEEERVFRRSTEV